MIIEKIVMIKKDKQAYKLYGEAYLNYRKRFMQLLRWLKKNNYEVILWGYGLKGMAFLRVCDGKNKYVKFVIDQDIKKQDKFALTGQTIVGIDQIVLNCQKVILIANKKLYNSICFDLINKGYNIKNLFIICLDEVMEENAILNRKNINKTEGEIK